MKIYVVGNNKNRFLLNDIRERFVVNQEHNNDNIDFLNPWYCELTAMYHLWKNCNDDIVGLEHYRRYFVNNRDMLLNKNEIQELLHNSDVVLTKWDYLARTKCKNSWEYLAPNTKEYILKFLDTVQPDEKDFILHDMRTATYFAKCNMFICNKEILNEYCKWFFPNATCFTTQELLQYPRCVGYVSEFIFGSFLKMKEYKITWQKSVEYDKTTQLIIGRF